MRLLGRFSTRPLQDFQFIRVVFYRDDQSGLRHVIILDLSVKRRCLYVIVGLNARTIAGEAPADQAGVYVSAYLGVDGLGSTPACFPAFDTASAKSALERVRQALEEHGMRWFAQFKCLSDLADALDEKHDMFKGELYLQDGKLAEAEVWLRRYESRLLAMDQTPDVAAALVSTREYLKQAVKS